MLSEAEPASPLLIKNIYASLSELLRSKNSLPKEFWHDTVDLGEYEKNQLIYAGTEAVWTQIKDFINKLKEFDEKNYKAKVKKLVAENSEQISIKLKEDILDYIRLH